MKFAANLTNSHKTMPYWLLVAVLFFMPFAKENHLLEHDLVAEKVQCQICSFSVPDDLAPTTNSLSIDAIKSHFLLSKTRIHLVKTKLRLVHPTRAPPLYFP
jgi:hypothetical protein